MLLELVVSESFIFFYCIDVLLKVYFYSLRSVEMKYSARTGVTKMSVNQKRLHKPVAATSSAMNRPSLNVNPPITTKVKRVISTSLKMQLFHTNLQNISDNESR